MLRHVLRTALFCDTNNMDISLFREFQGQFQNWTTEIFIMCHKTPRTELRNVLKNRGVYTPIQPPRST
jgi:hypothetical protein